MDEKLIWTLTSSARRNGRRVTQNKKLSRKPFGSQRTININIHINIFGFLLLIYSFIEMLINKEKKKSKKPTTLKQYLSTVLTILRNLISRFSPNYP